jgi:hypothetical protein
MAAATAAARQRSGRAEDKHLERVSGEGRERRALMKSPDCGGFSPSIAAREEIRRREEEEKKPNFDQWRKKVSTTVLRELFRFSRRPRASTPRPSLRRRTSRWRKTGGRKDERGEKGTEVSDICFLSPPTPRRRHLRRRRLLALSSPAGSFGEHVGKRRRWRVLVAGDSPMGIAPDARGGLPSSILLPRFLGHVGLEVGIRWFPPEN